MNISKYIAFAAVAAVALTGSATQFCVTCQDWSYYPEGSSISNNAWYALCWSKKSTFDGLKIDCTPVNSADKVCMIKESKTPFETDKDGNVLHIVVFDYTADLVGGKFFVVRLDTRGADGKPAENPVNKLQAVVVSGSCKTSKPSGITDRAVGAAWSDSVIDEGCGLKMPTITGFDVLDDGNVQIQVADMMPNVKYNVKMGSAPDALNEYGLTTPKWSDGEGEATITVPAKDAKFFRVTRDTVNK